MSTPGGFYFPETAADLDGRSTGMAPIRPAGSPRVIGDSGYASEKPSPAGNKLWEMSPLSIAFANSLSPVAIPMLAPIPSPLASFSGSGARLLNFLNERASTGVIELFNRSRQASVDQYENLNLQEIMFAGSLPMISPLSTDREHGFVVYLERQKHYLAEEQQDYGLATSAELRYEWVLNHHLIKLDTAKPTSYRPSAQHGQVLAPLSNPLDIRRLTSSNSVGGAIQRFFILNTAHTSLRVNGVMYGMKTLVGPLPDFAVIEVGKAAVFWWHTDESITYLPSLRDEIGDNKKRPLDIGEDYINLANIHPSKKQRLSGGYEGQRRTALPGSGPVYVPPSHPGHPPTGTPPELPPAAPQIPRPPHPPPKPDTPKPPPPTKNSPAPGVPPKGAPELQKPTPPPPPMDPPEKPGPTPKVPSSGPPPPDNKPPTRVNPIPEAPQPAPPLNGTISSSGIAAWRHEFQRRLREMQAKASKSPDDEDSAHQIVHKRGFEYDDGAIAIASVWEGVKLEGINYAFGNPDLFRLARLRMWLDSTCVGASHPLIMPLEFSESIKDSPPEEEKDVKPVPPKKFVDQMRKEEKEIADAEEIARKERLDGKGGAQIKWDTGPNHFVLAIAEQDPSSKTGVVITYMTSASTPSQGVIRAAARNIVRNSSWMPDGAWPNFSREVWQTVPQQTDDAAGGTHMVMNAWAFILNLTINKMWSISSEKQSNFYKEARTVINLALRGHMNGDTILSFLTAYGYARSQSTSQIQQLPRRVRSVFMNHEVLGDIVQQMRTENSKIGTGTTTGPIVKPPPSTNKPTLPPPPALPTPPLRPIRTPSGGIRVQGKTDWTDKLQRSLNACEARRKKLGKVKLHTIKLEELLDDDVILAIAAVWRGLWDDEVHFAFGTANLFQLARAAPVAGAYHGVASVGAPNDFIMPLLLDAVDITQTKGRIGDTRSQVGHYVLAIAERDSNDSQDVNIRIQNSAAGSKVSTRTRTAAQNIVRYSGWMGITSQGVPVDVQPTFTEEMVTVPQQTGVIECGFHVIFNAWAHMIGIPIINGSARSGTLPDPDFYETGVCIVNLALSGCMDSATIQAFFNHFGYCEPQDPADAVSAMQSIMMDSDILEDIIGEIQEVEKAIAATNGSAQGPAQGTAHDNDDDSESRSD